MKRLNRKARQYLLTGKVEAYTPGYELNGVYSGGRWGLEMNAHPQAVPLVLFFRYPAQREDWISKSPRNRAAVGVRHPLVKAFRRRAAGGSNQ